MVVATCMGAALSALMTSAGSSSGERAVFVAVFALLLAITLVPLGVARHPGMVDYPNHLARMHILAALADSPALAASYEILRRPVANLGMDLVVPPLARAGVGLEAATRAFVALTIVTFCGGVVLLAWAVQRRPPWLSLVVFAFVFNHYFLYGFLNYFFGIGAALMTLALWIRSGHWPRGLRLAVFSALSAALLVIHLMAVGIYALALAGYSVARRGHGARPPLDALAQFVVPGLLYVFAFQHVGGFSIDYDDPVKSKLLGLLGLFASYSHPWDGAFAVACALALGWLLYARRLALAAPGAGGAIGALVAAFLILPFYAMGSWMLDSRLSIAALCVALGFVGISRRNDFGRGALVLGTVLLVAVVAQRAWLVSDRWQGASTAFEEVRAALAGVEQGARLATVHVKTSFGREYPPVRHAAAFAVVDRDAFVPSLFAYPFNGESVAFREPHRIGADRFTTFRPGSRPDWEHLAERYDYVVLIEERPRELPPHWTKAASGEGFALLRAPADLRVRCARPPEEHCGADSMLRTRSH